MQFHFRQFLSIKYYKKASPKITNNNPIIHLPINPKTFQVLFITSGSRNSDKVFGFILVEYKHNSQCNRSNKMDLTRNQSVACERSVKVAITADFLLVLLA